MGAAGGSSRVLFAGVLAALLALALGAVGARAAACDTSWKAATDGHWSDAANWTNGVPTSADSACITVAGTYTVDITGQERLAKSLQLGGSSGTATLSLVGTATSQASLTLSDGGSISANGAVQLTENCASPGCVADPAASLLNASSSTPLASAGTILADAGSDGGLSSRELAGNVINTGTIDVQAPLTYAVGTLRNQGMISLGSQTMSLLFDPVVPSPSPAVVNDTGGTVSNGGGTGKVLVQASGEFTQGAGTTSPSGTHPAVVLDDSSYTDPLPTLTYTGGGQSFIEIRGGAKLSGNIASTQNLFIEGVQSGGSCSFARATAVGGFSNAGMILLTGPCGSGLAMPSGTLNNTGNLVADGTPGSITREIKGSLVNSGTLRIGGATAFDGSGATLAQTGGSTIISPHAVLDLSNSGATFRLRGGDLSGGGHTQAEAAVVNGSVNNTGGRLIPGGKTVPGLMSIDGSYRQGPGGELSELIEGTKVGRRYSELTAGGDLTLGGRLIIRRVVAPAVGHLYTILATNGHRTGRFSRVTGQFEPEGTFPPGWTSGYKLDYHFSDAVTLDGQAAAGLRVKRAGTGAGKVTSSPAGINCEARCDAPFFKTQTVTLTAHPSGASAFAGWSGACTGRARTCRVKMSRASTVTARFR